MHDLVNLSDQLATGHLRVQIGLEVGWNQAGRAVDALLERRLAGKAVLHVDQ